MIETLCKQAKNAARTLALAPTPQKNACLVKIGEIIQARSTEILSANQEDAQTAQNAGLSAAMTDRLRLNEKRLQEITASLKDVAALPDPVGIVFDEKTLPNGMRLHKQRVPIGVLAVIYESRPNVTIDVAGLALKTGNAIILRGGSETIATNRALVQAIRLALQESGLPAEAVQFIDSSDRKLVNELLKMHDYIDMLIPRGGSQLHQFCRENSSIPVITGGIGICHLYVDENVSEEDALRVIQNAKVQRPSVCNALDTVLVHRKIAADFLPRLATRLEADCVTLRAHENALPYLKEFAPPLVEPARPEDFDTEWLSLILGVKVVNGMDEAIEHIAVHSTGHSDGILTNDPSRARRFVNSVDSAAIYVNASTRFTDGGQFGLGAEVAISTQRLHARGPMGLEELTSYKWVAYGDYHTRP